VQQLAARGDFRWLPQVGAHRADPAEFCTQRSFFGLPYSCTVVYGSLRDPDGVIFTPMRRLYSGDGGKERLLLQTTLNGAETLRIHPAGASTARSTGWQQGFQGGVFHMESSAASPDARFRLVSDGTSLEWTEEGRLELHGSLVPPGLHWYLPGRDKGMYYASQLFELEGVILDHPVRGFIGFDDIYLPPGIRIYQGDALVGESLEVLWWTWATRYQDGSLEAGHFLFGHDRLGFALLTDERGRVSATTEVEASVTLGPDGFWPARLDLNAAGVDWEFLPDVKGHMVDLMPMPNPQTEGRWRRVGDARQPAWWFAWGETAPGHGQRRQVRSPA
jgi:hypothetical protein